MNDGYNRPVLVVNARTLLGALGKVLQEKRLAICNVSSQMIVGPVIEDALAQRVFEVLTDHQVDIVPGDLVRSEWQRINRSEHE